MTPPDTTLKLKSLVTSQQRMISELERRLRIERKKNMDLQVDLQKYAHIKMKMGGI